MILTSNQLRFLKRRAHNLNPAVIIGANGLAQHHIGA